MSSHCPWQRRYFVKACGDGDVDAIQLRLERGEDVESTDFQGNTGMHVAAAMSNVAVMELLLDNGADKEARNRNVRETKREREEEEEGEEEEVNPCRTSCTAPKSCFGGGAN